MDDRTLTSIYDRGGHLANFQDKSIQRSDCGAAFTYSIEGQEFYQSKGYANDPRRCPECRRTKKLERNNGSYGSPHQIFHTTCAECGKTAEVPFKPRSDKPVYCRDCYRKNHSPR